MFNGAVSFVRDRQVRFRSADPVITATLIHAGQAPIFWFLALSTRCWAVRRAMAQIVAVGLVPVDVGKTLPSIT